MILRPGRWRRFQLLPAVQRRALLSAFALLPLIWLALRVMSFRRVQACLARTLPPQSPAPSLDDASHARDLARMIAAAAREAPLPGKCLERSLALWWLLGRRGISTELRIGVRLDAGELRAHAWVELEGQVINDADSLYAGYAAFARDFGRLPAGPP